MFAGFVCLNGSLANGNICTCSDDKVNFCFSLTEEIDVNLMTYLLCVSVIGDL